MADSNVGGNGDGGALYNSDGTVTLLHTALRGNIAHRGGAIYQTGAGANAQMENTLVHCNTVGVALGAGIRSNGGTFTVTHTTIANNINGAGYSQSATTSEVCNSIAWGNTKGGFWVTSGTLNGTCSLDRSGNAGPALDPRFTDAANQDCHPVLASPAIDACATGLSPDLDNVARPFAAGYDMGAYEYAHDLTFAPDRTGEGHAGHSTAYTHTLTNTGGRTDTYTVSGESSRGWSVSVPSPVTLSAGEAISVEVAVQVPPGTPDGTVDTAVFAATVMADPALSAHLVNTTTGVCQPVTGADFVFAPSPAELNQPVVFTGIVAAGEPPIACLWHFGDGSLEQSGSPIAHTFTASNTFTVWMTATNACPSAGTAMREVRVLAYPDVSVTPLALDAALRPDETVTQSLTIGNNGDGGLTWAIAQAVAASWLSEFPTSGVIVPTGSVQIDIVFDSTGLDDGVYTATLRIDSDDPDNPAVDVPVSLTIAGDAFLYLPLVMRAP